LKIQVGSSKMLKGSRSLKKRVLVSLEFGGELNEERKSVVTGLASDDFTQSKLDYADCRFDINFLEVDLENLKRKQLSQE